MIRDPLISVCIPAFNAEDTLARCVSSVLKQKYESCEVIIVDDGSIDNTPNICSDLAANYENVTVFHQENRGQAAARSKAVSKAKGRYALFLDSDDELESNSLQLLTQAIDKTDADIIFFDYACVDFAGNKFLRPRLFPGATAEISRVPKNDVLVRFLAMQGLGAMTTHIVRADFAAAALKDESATHLRYREDVIQNMSLYSEAETFAYLRVPIYLYVANSKSVTHTIGLEKLWADQQVVQEAVHEFALKVPLDEGVRTEVERKMFTLDAGYITGIASKAYELPAVQAKELLKSIRASALFQRLRGKRGLKLSWKQRIVLMMLSGGGRFDHLLLFSVFLKGRLKGSRIKN